jgi:uncharacterized membrane protein YraQ (UPF0718 family)
MVNILIGTLLLWGLAFWVLARMRKVAPGNLPTVWAKARETLVFMVPRVVAGLVGAGFMAELLPVERVERFFGAGSGVGGVVLATVLGAATPGGPFVAFAIGASALKAGASWAPLMAYVTCWSVVNLNRAIAYELPMMGRQFTLLRAAISLPLALVLGLVVLLVQG